MLSQVRWVYYLVVGVILLSAMPGRNRKTDRRNEKTHLEAATRYAQALELRKGGATYQQIADALGYTSPGAARTAVTAGLKMIVQEPAEEVLQLELGRLDAMLMTAWGIMRDPTNGPQTKLSAMDRLALIMDRRARYLGLDAPEKIEMAMGGKVEVEHHVITIGGDEAEYLAALREARQLQREQAGLPQSVDDIVDAEIVEDTVDESVDSLMPGDDDVEEEQVVIDEAIDQGV